MGGGLSRQHFLGVGDILFIHHQTDAGGNPGVEIGAVEHEAFDSRIGEVQAGKIGFDRGLEAMNFDQRHGQKGFTSPAAVSSGVDARPRMGLRWGKRPKRAMMS